MNPDDLPVSPLEKANFLSIIFFGWLMDFFRLGSKREIELSDLYRVSPKNKSEKLGNDLAQAWRDQIQKADKWNAVNKDKPKNPSLTKAVVNVFFWQILVFGFFTFFEECILKIAQPIFLGLIIRYFAGEFDVTTGYLFGVGLFFTTAISTAQRQPYLFHLLQVGMKIRVACSALIYRKALKLSQAAIGKTNVGQLVNLLSNDVKRLDLSVNFLHQLWIAPTQVGVATYILWDYFGWPCLAGAALLLLFVPFQGIMGKLFGVLRLQVAERTDRRIRIMSEIVNAVRIIKMYAWELPFAKMIGEARKDEINYIRKTAFLHALNFSFYDISSKLVTFLTLLTYVLTGNFLTAEKVFVALSLYNTVRKSMTLFFPLAIAQLAESLVSIKRLENFLLLEEREMLARPNVLPTNSNEDCTPCKFEEGGAIIMTSLNARWSGTNNTDVNVDTLNDMCLNVSNGQLIAVVGSVGSGKTSLLQVLLYELPYSSGSLEMKGKLAYTCQDPWIFSGSIRDNILFGREYDYDRFQTVIKACALAKDLTMFPYQDQTLVGERGMSLSGGQKARVNLARAVYADTDIYLLDDPLSAVDAEVAKHIFEHCIMGLLKDKAKILVTHQLQFLKPANEILLLNKGKIEARGTFEELLETGINFTKALQTDEQSVTKSAPNPVESSTSDVVKMKEMENAINNKVYRIRRASMSLLEVGALEISTLNEEFEEKDEPLIAKSYGPQYGSSREKSKSVLSRFRKRKGLQKPFTSNQSTDDHEESSPLLPQQHQETISRGEVGLKLYWKYITAGASCFGLFIFLVSAILVQCLFSGSDYWLKIWTKLEENHTSSQEPFFQENSLNFENNREMHVYIYCALMGSLFIFSVIKNSLFFNICLNSSIELHRRLFMGVMGAPMRFFEMNSSGRVLNRFAKDIGIIDEMLPETLSDTYGMTLQVTGVVIIVSINSPYLVIPSLSLPFIFYYVRNYYLKTAKCVKHLEAIAKSPVFSHLSTSLYGLSTIRAMGVENQFQRQFDAHQDLHTASWVIYLGTSRWLGVVVEWAATVYIGVVAFTFLVMKGDESVPAIGLSIASAMSLCGMFQWGVRQSAEAENQMVSVERVKEYAEIEPEGELESNPDNKPPLTWPSKGEIIFKNVSLKYGDDPPVLKHITCLFKPQEKVGIVGRTGAGKSSLLTALFRITNPFQGNIEIDGLSTLQLGLHDLRNKISIIPQDPVLFNSTLRKNLDPFGDYADEELWNVLEQAYLADTVRESPAGLDMKIAEGGSNFSVGQRQLICLARAILRKNKILVLDEATANVDHVTDGLIQKAIREKFATCTVLTIAHRLHTVMDSDRILVLDAGEIKEFDEPYNLLRNEKSFLSQLVETTGKVTAANLYKIAKTTYDKKHFSGEDHKAGVQ